MFRSILARATKADSYYSLGGWIWLAFTTLTGLTGAAIMAWLLARLDWFWNSFQWAGVFGAAILTWLVIGLGLNLYALPLTFPRKNTKSLEEVRQRQFRNSDVRLDGKRFIGCELDNVSFIYNGEVFAMEHCTLGGIIVKTEVPEVEAMMGLLFNLGFLKVPVRGSQGELSPKMPMPDTQPHPTTKPPSGTSEPSSGER
jgi:hypothetical protein